MLDILEHCSQENTLAVAANCYYSAYFAKNQHMWQQYVIDRANMYHA